MRPLWASQARPLATFVPTDLGTTKLRLWLRPEGSKYQTSARSTLETGTGVIGSWTDESGNGFHENQATSGLRPSRKTGGGVVFNGSVGLSAVALGAWAADFVVLIAYKVTTHADVARVAEVNIVGSPDGGYALTEGFGANNITSYINFPKGGSPSISRTATDNAIHYVMDGRAGTTHSLAVDAGTAVTEAPSGAGTALVDTAFYVGTSSGSPGSNGITGDIYEVIVVNAPSAGDLTNLAAYMAARATSGVWV